MKFLQKLFGDNDRELKKYTALVEQINKLSAEFENKSDTEIKTIASDLRQRISATLPPISFDPMQRVEQKKSINQYLEPFLVESFALVREAARRTIGLRHYDVQLIGGAVLHHGAVAEMATGEGKTLTSSLPLYLNALTGLGSHLVTVNDYLARRDAGWMAPIYHFLGLTVGVIGPNFSYIVDPSFTDPAQTDERLLHLRPCERAEAYRCDITYGTNNEFGFDYLRDNMATNRSSVTQRPLFFAIVDEVDSILIDESRTPLIISSFSSESADLYSKFAPIMKKLKAETDYKSDEKTKTAALTEEGIKKVETMLGIDNLYSPQNASLVHYADTALRAVAMYKRNKDYVVKDDQVIIIDEFTGRMLAGRRYSSGLHQAIEAKEGVTIQQESVTMATITFQNYFRLYVKLAGMTGTASTEAEELSKIYSLEVVTIPTNRPNQRVDLPDLIYRTENAKFNAIANRVKELSNQGVPVLIGTVSIEKSERLSKLLKASGVKHEVLNAKQHAKEARIIAQAGLPGSVTVATNMAGRGVDIVLGGAAPADKKNIKQWQKNQQKVLESGGLFVLGTERHESRRIDNQLRGRAARQGDPGRTQFYLSMEDDLMRIFGGERMKSLMDRLNVPDDMSIDNKLLSRAIEQAQTKVEGHNFDIRKQLVEYDDVMNRHRATVYANRNAILNFEPTQADDLHEEILTYLSEEEEAQYEKKSRQWTKELRFNIERSVALRVIDVQWVEHLRSLDELRDSIGLRGYAQRDPLVEYKQEAYRLFKEFEDAVSSQIAASLLNVEIREQSELEAPRAELKSIPTEGNGNKKIGRNDPCPCGAINPKTGKVYKYKHCGLVNASWHKQQ